MGYIFDAGLGALRAVVGIPGASRMSEPAAIAGRTVDRAWVAPGARFGLAATDRKLFRFDLAAGSFVEIGDESPQQVLWSPSGRSAALRFSGGRIRVLVPVDSTAETVMNVVVEPRAGAVAVSDDGGMLLAIAGNALTAFSPGNEPRVLLTSSGLNAVAYFSGSRDAVVSDNATGNIYMLRESGEIAVLAQVDAPAAVAVIADNTHVLVATKGRVARIRIADRTVATAACSCAIETLERFGRDIFRVTGTSGGPVWLFDTARSDNPFTFVPQAENDRE